MSEQGFVSGPPMVDLSPIPLPDTGTPLVPKLPQISWEILQNYGIPNTLASEIPVAQDAEFGPELEPFARELLRVTAMPLDNVSRLAYRPNTHGMEGTLATAELYSGEVSFYSDMSEVSAEYQLEVAVHELAHVSTPSLERNNDVYGGRENRQKAQLTILRAALQTEATQIFLNDYHRYIYEQYQSGRMDGRTWFEETHAIALQMAAGEPEELARIDEMQYQKLNEMGLSEYYNPLVSRQDEEGNIEESGIDWILRTLTHIDSVEEMHQHFGRLRDALEGQVTPFHTNRALPRQIPGRIFFIVQQGGYMPRERLPWEDEILDLLNVLNVEELPLRRLRTDD